MNNIITFMKPLDEELAKIVGRNKYDEDAWSPDFRRLFEIIDSLRKENTALKQGVGDQMISPGFITALFKD